MLKPTLSFIFLSTSAAIVASFQNCAGNHADFNQTPPTLVASQAVSAGGIDSGYPGSGLCLDPSVPLSICDPAPTGSGSSPGTPVGSDSGSGSPPTGTGS